MNKRGRYFAPSDLPGLNSGQGKRTESKERKTMRPGNPSKRHRDRLNAELDNLARLLPFPEDIVTKLDKISILRLTVSYLRAKSFFQVSNGKTEPGETCEELVREVEGNGVFSQLSLEALDGFIAVITQDGQLFYVSENVRDFLGYSQAAVIHQSMFKFIHIDDQEMVRVKLAWPKLRDKKQDGEKNGNLDNDSTEEENEALNRTFTCRIKCTLNHGGGFYKLFKLSGRLREIQTLKRDNQVLEYGLFAICSPAHNGNSHSSTTAIKKEVAITAQKRLDRASSDPLASRRHVGQLAPHMTRPVSMNSFVYGNGRSSGASPLASPTASTDSGHPSPDSSQTCKTTFMDHDIHSDVSEVSTSSRSSQEVDGKTQESLLTQLRNGLSGLNHSDRRRSVTSAESGRSEVEEPHRKRVRSFGGVSEMFGSAEHLRARSMLHRSMTALPPVSEIKSESSERHAKSCTDSQEKSDGVGKPHDSRLDAARSLVNLGGVSSLNSSMYPFPPELAYPEMMFSRMDAMHEFPHLRSPFDIHTACCIGTDPYSIAMRRWLASPEMFRSPYSPLLASPASLLTPSERLRYFQFPFGYPYPFPPPSPFDLGAGLSERNLPEFALRSLHRNGPFMGPENGASNRNPRESPSTEKNSSEKQIKTEPVENGSEEACSGKEGPTTVQDNDTTENSCKENGTSDDEAKFVDVVGGAKPVDNLRQTLSGIQEAFSSRLENLKSSLQSLDRDNPAALSNK